MHFLNKIYSSIFCFLLGLGACILSVSCEPNAELSSAPDSKHKSADTEEALVAGTRGPKPGQAPAPKPKTNPDPHPTPPVTPPPPRITNEQIEAELGRGINDRNSYGETPLHEAVLEGDLAKVKLALQHRDVEVNAANYLGYTPLMNLLEVQYGVPFNPKIADALKKAGANVNYKDETSTSTLTPLVSFILESGASDSMAALEWLLAQDGLDPNKAAGIRHETPLTLAAHTGKLAIVEKLLQHRDIDPNKQDGAGYTPLMQAVIGKHVTIVEKLLKHRDIDPNKQNGAGYTPLMQAVIAEYETIVEKLLQHRDIDPNKQDKAGDTPLGVAEEFEYTAIANMLRAHLNFRDANQ